MSKERKRPEKEIHQYFILNWCPRLDSEQAEMQAENPRGANERLRLQYESKLKINCKRCHLSFEVWEKEFG